MADEFGAGLASFFGADAPADVAAPQAAPQPATDASGALHTFGQGLNRLMNGPSYHAPDPEMTPLDQTADVLQQRVKRANDIAANPLLQVFNPEGVAKARAFVPQATEQLQKIRQQKADMIANRTEAQTLGLAPGQVPDEASRADRVAVAQSEALKGNLRVFKGLQAVDPTAAAAIQDQVYNAVGGHLTKAQLAFDSLSGMQNQGQYAAKLNQLRQNGTLGDLEAMGLKVPASFDAFSNGKGIASQTLREARIGLDTIRQKLEERNTYIPMEEKEAKTYAGSIKTVYGDDINAGPWSRNAAAGTRGMVVNGGGDARDLRTKYALASPEQRKALKEEIELAVPKEEREKFRAFNRMHTLAEPTEAQKKNGDVLNTNPNVQQGIAEGLASMLRGGSGGANPSLLNIELSKRGAVQGFLDAMKSNYAGGINTLSGEQVRAYLTTLTQQQQRDVIDGIKQWNDASIIDRVGSIAKRAGALGLDAAAIGFGSNEAAGAVQAALDEGRQAQIERMLPYMQPIGSGNGVLQLGAQHAGVGAQPMPAGTQNTTQLSGAPLQTPVQQATNPAPPSPGGSGGQPSPPSPVRGSTLTPPTPGQPGEGSSSHTVAGVQVTAPMPGGASPDYVARLQRIESGNERSPWTAGAKGSSASGAFQFINSTWAANKPPGAPARAADATPEQQTQALANLTAKNAVSLKGAGVPVNDTTLYVAHNLGSGGASQLLSASPTQDARSIVGEAAARNNPLFFKGRPTVATVLQRYQDEMDKAPAGGTRSAQPSTAGAPASFFDRLTGRQPGEVAKVEGTGIQGDHVASPEERAGSPVVEYAPAIGSTVGAITGAGVGPVGTIGGGAAGGAAGQAFQDWMRGNAQNPAAIAKQAALGGVLGVAPAGRPILGAAARVAGVAGTEAGAAAIEGKSGPDVTDVALKGAAYALGGEALGKFIGYLGPAAHKVISNYTDKAQVALSEQAGKLAEARKVLETEQPKLPGANGASTPNPKYEAAQAEADKATQYIKDHGQNPDDMVYAYDSAKAGTSTGEAATMRKATIEKAEVSKGYDQLRQDMKDQGVGKVKANQAVPEGPLAQLRTSENPTGKVAEEFRRDAEHAEMLIKAPAANWGEKWRQLQNAGSELIDKRMAFLANADKPSAKAMDRLFEGVRNQQKAVAEYVFGPEKGRQVIRTLEGLDKRYAQIMTATQGLKYEKMQSVLATGNTPAARELEANFKAFAKDDPSAIRAFNAMKAGARGNVASEAKLMAPLIAAETVLHGVPTLSMAFGGYRLAKMMQGYMNARVLGKEVKFKDFLRQELSARGPSVAAEGAQRAAVMQPAQ